MLSCTYRGGDHIHIYRRLHFIIDGVYNIFLDRQKNEISWAYIGESLWLSPMCKFYKLLAISNFHSF